MPTAKSAPSHLGTTAAARILNLSTSHFLRLAEDGAIPCTRDSANRRVFLPADIERIARERAAKATPFAQHTKRARR